jgi:ammonia channel protein AmtB
LGIGTLTSIISALLIDKLKFAMNTTGVRDSNGIVGSYLIPGLIAGILSAIFQAKGAELMGSSDAAKANTDPGRSKYVQGGFQAAGFVIAIVLGSFAGIAIGFLMRIFNKRSAEDQFSPNFIVVDKMVEGN